MFYICRALPITKLVRIATHNLLPTHSLTSFTHSQFLMAPGKTAKRKASTPSSQDKRARREDSASSAASAASARSADVDNAAAGTLPESANNNTTGATDGNGATGDAGEINDGLRRPHHNASLAEEHNIVIRRYYPAEMSNARAHAYIDGHISRPVETLKSALDETIDSRSEIKAGDAVVHWFKCDLRTRDNRALWMAGQKANEAGVPLVGVYIISPQDFEAHLTAAVRVDLILRTLVVLRNELAKLDIPLYVETVERRREIPTRIEELLNEWGARHLYANMEYEVDELRREARMVRSLVEKGVSMYVVHDTCVINPGDLKAGSGKQYAVYTPWYRTWCRHLGANQKLLDVLDQPSKNPKNAREKFSTMFDAKIPQAPEGKKLNAKDAKRIASLWPAGELEARTRLDKFCKEKGKRYKDARNFPATDGTSALSPYLASGAISARMCVKVANDSSGSKNLYGGSDGVQTWISEVAWRDFYKHVLANWPYVCMNKPFKPEYSNIEWSYDKSHFEAWCLGQTGFPIVDAAMRQIHSIGWMHNRCRMIVSSFLAKDLLIDWRMGERFFMEHLIDGDFASNSGGWGFGASVGVDPQPYFRIFNPLLQSEKFDRDGDYIRKWVPELAGIKGKAVHDPYGRGEGKKAEAAGYPKPLVEHKEVRERALEAYRRALS